MRGRVKGREGKSEGKKGEPEIKRYEELKAVKGREEEDK